MIAFTLDGKEGKMLGLGITDANIEALKQGKPILKNISEYYSGPLDKVLIMYGKTEFAIVNDFKKNGIKINKMHTEGFVV
ncbi:hypothetical protein N9948_01895 [bacterium]|nr:hypothetical protein [bacterium]